MKSEFGKTFKVIISGGSHEPEMTVDISGLPGGFTIDMGDMRKLLERRSPGGSDYTTSRHEKDLPLLRTENGDLDLEKVIVPDSGRLCFVIKNEDVDKKAYDNMLPRPGHADMPAYFKYNGIADMSGGGPFSGRMTVMLCIAGAIAMQYLKNSGILISSRVLSIGQAQGTPTDLMEPKPMPMTEYMKDEIESAKNDGNSVGGVVEAFAEGLPTGMGGPMYDGIESVLSPIVFGIPAVKGVEFGNGFAASYLLGSENNDDFVAITGTGKILTATNNHGGILGGMTTGMPLIMRVAFKPAPSISKRQYTVDPKTGRPEELIIKGRHDACFVPRAAAAVEAALAAGLLDVMLSEDAGKNSVLKTNAENTLSDMREAIDHIDEKIKILLTERMHISEDIAKYKIKHDIPVTDTGREAIVLDHVGPDLKDIYEKIMEKSREKQNLILKEHMPHGGKEAESK